MKKNAFRKWIWVIICILVLSIVTVITKSFYKQDLKGANISSSGLFDTKKTALDVIAMNVVEEIPLTMSNVSSIVLHNVGVEDDASSKRAGLLKFFYIPINSGSVINIKNNSEEFKFSVTAFFDDLIYDYTGSGWVEPGAETSYTLEADRKYISLNIARADEGDIDISTVDLSEFIITYSEDEKNLLDTLLSMAEDYKSASLKDYDNNKLTELSNKSTVAHACGTDINADQLTLSALKNAVETDGFKAVELDIRETVDNVLICYHDESLTGAGISVRYSTLADLKAKKADIATLEELLSYCGQNGTTVVLDVKSIYSKTAISHMFSLIENNGLQDKFFFAGCPKFLLDNMPEQYKSISYSVYSGWDDSYNGQNNIRFSNRCGYRLELNKIANLLRAGHRSFELFDADKKVSSTEPFKKDLSIFMYLCSVFDANYNLTLYNNISVPVLTEKELIGSMPKNFWDSFGMLNYEE